jgi:hypothetical protein
MVKLQAGKQEESAGDIVQALSLKRNTWEMPLWKCHQEGSLVTSSGQRWGINQPWDDSGHRWNRPNRSPWSGRRKREGVRCGKDPGVVECSGRRWEVMETQVHTLQGPSATASGQTLPESWRTEVPCEVYTITLLSGSFYFLNLVVLFSVTCCQIVLKLSATHWLLIWPNLSFSMTKRRYNTYHMARPPCIPCEEIMQRRTLSMYFPWKHLKLHI